MPNSLRLPEGPKRLARSGIDGHHLPAGTRNRVEDTVSVDRPGPEEVVGGGAKVVAPPDPRGLQVPEVVGADLVQGRVASVPRIAAQITPLTVLGPR